MCHGSPKIIAATKKATLMRIVIHPKLVLYLPLQQLSATVAAISPQIFPARIWPSHDIDFSHRCTSLHIYMTLSVDTYNCPDSSGVFGHS